MKKLNLTSRGIKWLIVDIAAVLVLIAGVTVLILTLTGSSSSTTLTSVQHAPSAASVASSLGCGQYKEADLSGAHIYVVDAGVCWIGGTKYGVDTFASKTVRDEWIKAAGTLGVTVLKQNDTAVFYKASDQTHDNK